MSNYIKRDNKQTQPIKQEREVAKAQPDFDINALANAVAAAISSKIPQTSTIPESNLNVNLEGKMDSFDTFDTSKTMNRLADQMLIERGNGKANFEDLGSVRKTKKDQKDVDNTIDLLKKIND